MSERILRPSTRRIQERRWVGAPTDGDPTGANRILGVWLARGERITWEWAMRDHGRPYVCGYAIEGSRRAPAPAHRTCGFRVDA
jgi:hypothetical protein